MCDKKTKGRSFLRSSALRYMNKGKGIVKDNMLHIAMADMPC